MKVFNTISEVNLYIDYLKELDNTINNLILFREFIRFSPERIAKKFKLNELDYIKKLNIYKKEIHKKIIITERVEYLKNIEPTIFIFNYSEQSYKTRICICEKYFEVKYKTKKVIRFYPTIKYLYLDIEDKIIIFYNPPLRLYATNAEFYKNFIDIREYKLNQIIN